VKAAGAEAADEAVAASAGAGAVDEAAAVGAAAEGVAAGIVTAEIAAAVGAAIAAGNRAKPLRKRDCDKGGARLGGSPLFLKYYLRRPHFQENMNSLLRMGA